MHVLVVPSWYPTSEAPLTGIYFFEQAKCLARHDLSVGVIYPEQQSLRLFSWDAVRRKHFQTEWTSEDGIPTLRRYSWNVWWQFPPGVRWRVRSAVRLGHQYVDRFGVPDVIHAQSGRWAGAAAARLSDDLSIPYVLTEHFTGFQRHSIPSWRWSVIREGYRSASGITAVSTALKQTLVRQGLAAASSVDVHPNLAPVSVFTRPPKNRPSPPPFHFVTIARLTPQKNVGGLLDAFQDVAERTADVSLTVVGDGPERNALEQKAKRLGVASQVSFLGRLDRESVREQLWDAHAFVLPSHHETFGVVVLEAMATGLPVVATASGGPEDILTEETGILVPVHEPKELTDALLKIQGTWTSYEAGRIRNYVLDRYGPEPFVRRTLSLYNRVLSDETLAP